MPDGNLRADVRAHETGHGGYNPPINDGTQGVGIFDRFVYETNAH